MKLAKASSGRCAHLRWPVAASELLHWSASGWDLPAPAPRGRCALIVLGYPTKRSGELRSVQRWRVEMAKRALERLGAELVVFSGVGVQGQAGRGRRHGRLRRVARRARPPDSHREPCLDHVGERRVLHALLENFDRLAFVSDPLHAARARRYLKRTAPRARRAPCQRRRVPLPGALVAQSAGGGLRTAGALPHPALMRRPSSRLSAGSTPPLSVPVPRRLIWHCGRLLALTSGARRAPARAKRPVCAQQIRGGPLKGRRLALSGAPLTRARQLGRRAGDAPARRPRPPPPRLPGRDRRAR